MFEAFLERGINSRRQAAVLTLKITTLLSAAFLAVTAIKYSFRDYSLHDYLVNMAVSTVITTIMAGISGFFFARLLLKLHHQKRVHTALAKANQAMIRSDDVDAMMEDLCGALVESGNLCAATILMRGESKGWRVKAMAGPHVHFDREALIRPATDSLLHRAALRRRVMIRNRADTRDTGFGDVRRPAEEICGSTAVIPLVRDRHCFALVALHAPVNNVFRGDVLQGFEEMASNIVFSLDRFAQMARKKKAEKQIQYLATHDVMTGLPNRSAFDSALARCCAERRSAALLFIDVNNFKVINDTLGHQAGDMLLAGLAHRLRKVVGEIYPLGFCGRFAGDELVALVPAHSIGEVERLAAALHEAFSEALSFSGHVLTPSASIGFAMAEAEGFEPERLLRAADHAMYLQKRRMKDVSASHETTEAA